MLTALLEPFRDNLKAYYSRDPVTCRDATEDYAGVRWVFGGSWAAIHKPSMNRPSMSNGASPHGSMMARTALKMSLDPRDVTSNEVLETVHAYDNLVYRHHGMVTDESMEAELIYCARRRQFDKQSAADRNAGRKLNCTGATAMEGLSPLPKNHEIDLAQVPAAPLEYGAANNTSLKAGIATTTIPEAKKLPAIVSSRRDADRVQDGGWRGGCRG